MKSLTLDGIEYVKASEAAKLHGYTSDYVGQLCRGKKVTAQLVGRSWYVNIDSLLEHRKGRYRSNQKKTSQIVKEDIKKATEKPDVQPHYYERLVSNTEIRYESDEEELLPTLKKVAVVSSEPVEEPEEQEIKVVEAAESRGDYFLETESLEKPTRGTLAIVDEDNPPRAVERAPKTTKPAINRGQSPELHNRQPEPSRRSETAIHDVRGRIEERPKRPRTRKPIKHPPSNPKSFASDTILEANHTVEASLVSLTAPVSLSLLAGLAVAALLVSFSWEFDSSSEGSGSGYSVNVSSVIQAIKGDK